VLIIPSCAAPGGDGSGRGSFLQSRPGVPQHPIRRHGFVDLEANRDRRVIQLGTPPLHRNSPPRHRAAGVGHGDQEQHARGRLPPPDELPREEVVVVVLDLSFPPPHGLRGPVPPIAKGVLIELRVLKGTVARMKFVVQRPFQKAKANKIRCPNRRVGLSPTFGIGGEYGPWSPSTMTGMR